VDATISEWEAVSHGRAVPRLGFVVCPSFHGATLLALLLNNHSAISALGDTNPTRGYDQICACRAKVSECGFWQTVSERLDTDRFSNLNVLLPEVPWPISNRLEGLPLRVSRHPTVNRAAGRVGATAADWLLPLIWRRSSAAILDYMDVWTAFYRLVSDLHNTSVVVDGSKHPRKVSLMARKLGPPAEIRVIHLVRDPRGFVASRCRNIEGTDLRSSAWLWADMHRRIETLQSLVSYRRVRYEDLVLHTETEMAAIFEFLGLPGEAVVGPTRFHDKHHLMGNAMLFHFDGSVTLDERWREALTPHDQLRVLRFTGEMARRCGYF
jgi:Sulfotransferase family